ncbi:hypothetical protein DIPPA_09595 [Diplonema papillatum]|nr:hypothetical protein DIPPA_09595 [Diplonema papillatum]
MASAPVGIRPEREPACKLRAPGTPAAAPLPETPPLAGATEEPSTCPFSLPVSRPGVFEVEGDEICVLAASSSSSDHDEWQASRSSASNSDGTE